MQARREGGVGWGAPVSAGWGLTAPVLGGLAQQRSGTRTIQQRCRQQCAEQAQAGTTPDACPLATAPASPHLLALPEGRLLAAKGSRLQLLRLGAQLEEELLQAGARAEGRGEPGVRRCGSSML